MLAVNKSFIKAQLLSDFLLIAASFIASASMAQSLGIFYTKLSLQVLFLILLIVWYFGAKISGIYDNITHSPFLRFIAITKNVFIQSFTAILFIFIIKELLFTRNFVLYYTLLLLASVTVKSFILTRIYRRKKGKDSRRSKLLIIGTGELGRNFYAQFSSYSNLDYEISGFADKSTGTVDNKLYLGKTEDLEKIIKEHAIDEVVLALEINEITSYPQIISVCNNAAVRVHILPDYLQYMTKNISISAFDDFPIITLRSIQLDQFHWKFIKRAFDIIFSSLVLILIGSWLFLLIALIQKLTSKGPVFYIQDRVGRKNEIFKCYKFRTMTVDPNRELEFNPTLKNTSNITPLGNFLRKTNLDEMPQFINVFIGNMSVVGPRPHAIQFDKKYSEFVEEIRLRHIVKPGITGWAQVHGLRGDSLDEEENKIRTRDRINHDIWYIENWSIGLDIQIIFLTFFQIIKGKAKGL